MGNSIINWIEQWLKDRRQRVVVDGEVSSWKPVLGGVPQGSVLGPILLLIYINDLEEGVTGNILKFADDTKLFRKVREIGDKQKLQDDIDKFVKWSKKWQMLFNFGKCKCLHTGSGSTGFKPGTHHAICVVCWTQRRRKDDCCMVCAHQRQLSPVDFTNATVVAPIRKTNRSNNCCMVCAGQRHLSHQPTGHRPITVKHFRDA